MSDLLTVSDLSAAYDGPEVLRNVDVRVEAGEGVAVLGANGAGKSTLLRTIMGQVYPTSGTVTFLEQNLADMPNYRRVRMGLGYAPEGRALFGLMSVQENLLMGAQRVGGRDAQVRLERVVSVFPKLGRLLPSRCQLLSGGEQQMVAVGRALMTEPRILVLDEPSTGLAPRVVGELYAALAELRRGGLAVLVAEQNAKAALRFVERAYVLEDGAVTASERAADLLNDARLAEAYVGKRGDTRRANARPSVTDIESGPSSDGPPDR